MQAWCIINSTFSLSPFSREWGMKNSKLLIMVVFPVISPHLGVIQDPTQSDLIRTKDTPVIQEIIGTRVKNQILGQKMILLFS